MKRSISTAIALTLGLAVSAAVVVTVFAQKNQPPAASSGANANRTRESAATATEQRQDKAAAERNAAYFDGVNFAARVKTSIRFLVGFADMTCPPADVYAAYNVCPSNDKAIINAIGSGHSWFDWHARSLKTPTGFDYEAWLRVPVDARLPDGHAADESTRK